MAKQEDYENYADSSLIVVSRDDTDGRSWMENAVQCPFFSQYNIQHAGVMDAGASLEVLRLDQSGSYFMATVEGEGEVMIDGVWRKLTGGQAVLLPPFMSNAFRSSSKPWQFCWVRYMEKRNVVPIATANSPVRGEFRAESLRSAIRGLHQEAKVKGDVAAQNLWMELIQHYVQQFARPVQSDDRLWKVWNLVKQNLSYHWSLAELSSEACMSAEHFRRVCQKQLGRSPMQHVTYLRMEKARLLLSTTDEKVEQVALSVGYKSSFTFSNMFKKWIGVRPSEMR